MFRALLTGLLAAVLSLTSPFAAADALDDVRARGSLRVGVSLFEPWTMRADDGTLSGFEVDVAGQLAKDLGVKAELRVYPWDGIIDALEKGEIDVIVAGMAITPARALRVAFSVPYADSGVSIATNTRLTQAISGLAELNAPEIHIATVSETQAAGIAPSLFDKAKISEFTQPAEAERQVLDGKAHVYLATVPEVRFLALRHPDRIDLPLAEPLIESKAGLAVQRGAQGLLNYLNAWVTARQADRWLATHHRYWFDSVHWLENGLESGLETGEEG